MFSVNHMSQTNHSSTQPHVAIVVLNWNGKEDTLACLDSLKHLAYPNHSIVVVDNGSTDGSASVISQAHPGVTLIQNNSNLGYAGGNNVGIQHALDHGAEYILLLNNDTVVDSHLLDEFVRAAAALPNFGAFSGKIYHFDPPDIIWYAGARWISKTSSFIHIGAGQHDSDDFSNIAETDYASGCAFFVAADSFRKIGLLDENMYLMYEESDWCYRARKSGLRSYYIPTAKLWHKISVSIGGYASPLGTYFLTRNRLLWSKRHLSLFDRLGTWKETLKEYFSERLPTYVVEGNGLRAHYWGLLTYMRNVLAIHQSPRSIARRIAIKDYLASRFGDCPPLIRNLRTTRSGH